jgi:ubiquinone/menaquinone biosynthesis C-methylase UbiE
MTKDLFSKQSSEYAKFRPAYPESLIKEIISKCKSHHSAWDAGTGNGQMAALLAPHFTSVFASDLSDKQLSNAKRVDNVKYFISNSYETSLQSNSIDLITVAQAVHWFDFEKFYTEVKRVASNDALIAVVGYGVMRSTGAVDQIIQDFYHGATGPYWDKERRYLDEEYKTIPFPFTELKVAETIMQYTWNIDQLIGYFSTWSALQHLINATGIDPLPELREKFLATDQKEFLLNFPLYIRIGVVQSKA